MANSGSNGPQQPQHGQVAAEGLFARVKAVASGILAERKPWTELADRNAFARPASFAEALSRFKKNSAYFRINYFIFILLTTVVCMVINPSSLVVLGLLGALWFYLFIVRSAAITIGGRPFSPREQLVAIAVISVVVVFFLTSVGTILFTAIGISLVAIAAHGALRVPDDLFLDDGEIDNRSVFAFLSAKSAAANNSVLAFLMGGQPPQTASGPNAV